MKKAPAFCTIDTFSSTPRTQQWSFGIEQELTSNPLLDVAYVASASTHLTHLVDINQKLPKLNGTQVVDPTPQPPPYPSLASYSFRFENATSANYNSLLVKLEKQYSAGLSLLSSYTWSKALDSASSARDGPPQPTPHLFDRRWDYGPSVFDVAHNWVNSALYELPCGRGKRWGRTWSTTQDKLLGGWQIGGIAVFRTGFPFSCQVGSGPSVDASANFEEDNCDLVGNVNPDAGPHTLQQWFNVADFTTPNATEVFGNAGRNDLRGPRYVTFDFSAIKLTNVTEKLKLQFRFEAFNALNHPVFSTPNNFLDNLAIGPQPDSALGSYAGSIGNTATDNRQLHFALKVIW